MNEHQRAALLMLDRYWRSIGMVWGVVGKSLRPVGPYCTVPPYGEIIGNG